jgi:protein involved in ribonucleotide reduction
MAAPAFADAPVAAQADNTTPMDRASEDRTPGEQTPDEQTHSHLIYFSSASENTRRFIDKLGTDAARIPLYPKDQPLTASEPYVLVVPTYGGTGGEGSVPKQVIRFLNNPQNRRLLRGVIGAGNTNFGDNYCMAGDIIAAKCGVPHLYRFELMGTPEDVDRVQKGLEEFWTRLSQTQK